MSFPDQEKILKQLVFNLAVSMNANTGNSQIKHQPCSKYFKVRNFSETKFCDFANLRKFRTAKYLIW